MTEPIGRKDDKDKLRFDLLPFEQVAEVVAVLTAGAKRYGDDNWKFVPRAEQRYLAAALRHIFAAATGERSDPDDGYSHLAHAVCCLLFMMWLEDQKS